nr:MAG TPA: hypothetical protein [Caudoviricetes sp.]
MCRNCQKDGKNINSAPPKGRHSEEIRTNIVYMIFRKKSRFF